MTYHFMKVLSNVKYQYSSFVNVVTMRSIDSNNLKLPYWSLYVINNQSEIAINWDWRKIETNLQPQSQAFNCISFYAVMITSIPPISIGDNGIVFNEVMTASIHPISIRDNGILYEIMTVSIPLISTGDNDISSF